MIDYIVSVIKNGKDRLKSPFISTFIIYWIIYNWKPLFIISKMDMSAKETINEIITSYETFYIKPLALSVFSVLALPYIHGGIDFLVSKAEKWRTNILSSRTINRLENEIEEAKLQSKLADTMSDFKTKEELRSEIEDFQKKMYDTEASILKKDESIKSLEKLNEDKENDLIYEKEKLAKVLLEKVASQNVFPFQFSASPIYRDEVKKALEQYPSATHKIKWANNKIEDDIYSFYHTGSIDEDLKKTLTELKVKYSI